VGAGKIRWESRVAGFGRGQRDERGAGRRLRRSGSPREVVLDRDADEEGTGEQHEGEMYVIQNTSLSHFVVISLIEHSF
jgi:hypothetical protein